MSEKLSNVKAFRFSVAAGAKAIRLLYGKERATLIFKILYEFIINAITKLQYYSFMILINNKMTKSVSFAQSEFEITYR